MTLRIGLRQKKWVRKSTAIIQSSIFLQSGFDLFLSSLRISFEQEGNDTEKGWQRRSNLWTLLQPGDDVYSQPQITLNGL